MRLHEAGQPNPVVSVIMPVCNEGTFIRRSLGAVTAQEYPRELLEILVVDGMSRDQTRELVLAAGRDDPRIRLIDNPRRIVSCAFNLGLREARGDVIVRVDGHTIIAADYVASCVAALQRTGAENVGGRMQPEGSTPFGRAVAMATSVPFGVGGGRFHYSANEEWVDTVYLGAWRRELFDRLGGFDEEMVRNQDDEFNYRLREAGGRILLSPAIRSRYFNRTNPHMLWKQYFAYGYWKVRVMQKHPRQMRARHFAPAGFVLGMLLLGLLAAFGSGFELLLPAALLAYPGAGALITYRWRERMEPGLGDRLVLAFLILHIAYGTGFLFGLGTFLPRWFAGEGKAHFVPSMVRIQSPAAEP